MVYRYRDEATGLAAGEAAVEIVQALHDGVEPDLQMHIDRLKEVRDANALGPSTGSIVDAARARNIPYYRLTEGTSYIQLGHGAKQRRFQATVTDASGIIGHSIADDKEWTKQILGEAGVPVPQGQVCHSWEDAQAAAAWIGWPVVAKPLSGNHGRGVTTSIASMEDLETGYEAACAHHETVLVERYIKGEDHRMLVIDGKLVAAARRRPAHVVGDGKKTIRQLVDKENEDPRRGVGHENLLTQIHVDTQTHRMLEQAGLALDTVLPEGEVAFLKSTANISTGGTATDLTDEVHPDVRFAMERIGRLIGLDIIGIDLLAEDLTRPLEQQSAGVVEVNAGPGFRMHMSPTHGTPRPVGEHVVDMLFPDPTDNGRVPITAITGTNGKTTTTRLITHILRQAGNSVGMGCTGTVEIDNHVILRGDYSGPAAAQAVLKEPTVEHAVLEVARGGIMRRGLGFDECDVGVLLNIASDHLDERDILTLEDLARCKTVVVDAVKSDGGYCVLNADDPLVMEQGTYWARGEIIYFTMDPDQRRRWREHLDDHAHGAVREERQDRSAERQGHGRHRRGQRRADRLRGPRALQRAERHGRGRGGDRPRGRDRRYPRRAADLPPDTGADAGPYELFRGGWREMPDRLRPQRPGAGGAWRRWSRGSPPSARSVWPPPPATGATRTCRRSAGSWRRCAIALYVYETDSRGRETGETARAHSPRGRTPVRRASSRRSWTRRKPWRRRSTRRSRATSCCSWWTTSRARPNASRAAASRPRRRSLRPERARTRRCHGCGAHDVGNGSLSGAASAVPGRDNDTKRIRRRS
ncbi:MAG: Mur ligase family protein [Gammaproteobacteria bacterium]|nr:Mur ligase family protein [Gammaproteobacteria bacterium]